MCQNRRETIITKHPLWGEGGGAAAAAEEFSEDLHHPMPSHPGMKYPVRAYPSLPLAQYGLVNPTFVWTQQSNVFAWGQESKNIFVWAQQPI